MIEHLNASRFNNALGGLGDRYLFQSTNGIPFDIIWTWLTDQFQFSHITAQADSLFDPFPREQGHGFPGRHRPGPGF